MEIKISYWLELLVPEKVNKGNLKWCVDITH